MEQTYNPRRIFNITLSIILITISAGFITAVKTSGGLFSDSFNKTITRTAQHLFFFRLFFEGLPCTFLVYTVCACVFRKISGSSHPRDLSYLPQFFCRRLCGTCFIRVCIFKSGRNMLFGFHIQFPCVSPVCGYVLSIAETLKRATQPIGKRIFYVCSKDNSCLCNYLRCRMYPELYWDADSWPDAIKRQI